MNVNQYQLLKKKLKKDNISISDIDLNKVMYIYLNLLNFVFDYSVDKKQITIDSPFNYLIKEDEDCHYYMIFTNIIYLYKKDLIKYVDYVYLYDSNPYHHYSNNLHNLWADLSYMVELYESYGDDTRSDM